MEPGGGFSARGGGGHARSLTSGELTVARTCSNTQGGFRVGRERVEMRGRDRGGGLKNTGVFARGL